MSFAELGVIYVGIYATFIAMGYFQEKVTRTPYKGAYFDFPLFLVLVQCVLNTIVAYGKLTLFPKKKDKKKDEATVVTKGKVEKIPLIWIITSSFAYVAAVVASNGALIYVNFPTQVLAKSCKMIPVILLGFLIARKKYKIYKIAAVLVITIGISLFMLSKSGKKKENKFEDEPNPWGHVIGVGLLLFSLLMDGVNNAFQTKITEQVEKKPSGDEMMYFTNFYASFFVGIAILFTQEYKPAIAFCAEHTDIIWDISFFSVTMAVGQIFIFWCVSSHGNLLCSFITTTRKFFTILLSVVWYGHVLSTYQWIGCALVFIGILFDVGMTYMNTELSKNSKKIEPNKIN